MALIDRDRPKSEQEVISILEQRGIQVVMKPIALIPENMNTRGFGRESILFEEMGIYDALELLERRHRLSTDPFSK